MVTIIYGDDTVSSRQYFLDLRQKSGTPPVFDGEKLELTDLVQQIEGGELFQESKQIFIEDFLSKKKSGKEIEKIMAYLTKNDSSQVYLWEGKKIVKKNMGFFKNVRFLPFDFPKIIFTFLDSIKPNNPPSVSLFHNVLKNIQVEIVFFLLIRQFRLLLSISDLGTGSSKKAIDEVKRLAPWQIAKLQRQARLFPKGELKDAYKKLFELDLAQKTGATPLSLVESIDFFLLDL